MVSLSDFGFNVISFLKNNWISVYFLCLEEFKLHKITCTGGEYKTFIHEISIVKVMSKCTNSKLFPGSLFYLAYPNLF